jgi:hypothetical protein
VNTYLPTTPILKPPTPVSIHIFEMVQHPYGIGPIKPIIRMPISSTGNILAPHSQPNIAQPISLVLPPLPVQSTVTVQCQCRQLVHVSLASQLLQLPTTQLPLLHSFPTHISNFLLNTFSLPSLFFSHLGFLMAMRVSRRGWG